MVKEALTNGAKGYIVKPFKGPRVLEEVNKVLGS
jgi:AmiR/NasT family two-component response regulator